MRHYTSSAEQYHRPYNTAAGYRALAANTTGRLGTAAGVNALLRNTTGQENTAVGVDAMLQQRDREQITRNFHYCLSDHQCAGEGKQFRRPRTSIGDDRFYETLVPRGADPAPNTSPTWRKRRGENEDQAMA
jgi:hypothetical protein